MTIKIAGKIFYLVGDLTKLLSLTPITVRSYIKQNKIKGTKAGRRWVVSEKDLINFMEGKKED